MVTRKTFRNRYTGEERDVESLFQEYYDALANNTTDCHTFKEYCEGLLGDLNDWDYLEPLNS